MIVWPLTLKSNTFLCTRITKTYFHLRLIFYTVTHEIEFADSLIVFWWKCTFICATWKKNLYIKPCFYFSVWRVTSNVIFLFPFKLLKRFIVYKCKCVNFMHPCNCLPTSSSLMWTRSSTWLEKICKYKCGINIFQLSYDFKIKLLYFILET